MRKTTDGSKSYEILGLHLRAQLVTLSACETALGSGYFTEIPAGDEFVGLTRAFLVCRRLNGHRDPVGSQRQFYCAAHAELLSQSFRGLAIAIACHSAKIDAARG